MLIIERFVEDQVIIEENRILKKYPRALFDPSCREGDVIEETDGIYYPDKQKTEELRKAVIQRLKNLGL